MRIRPQWIGLGASFSCVILAIVLGCMPGSNPPSKPDPHDVPRVSPSGLVRIYRDLRDADSIYTGQVVCVNLEANDYTTEPGVIHWRTGRPGNDPVIVFYVSVQITDSSRPLEITGRCMGRTVDGRNRGSGINWCLKVEDCSVGVR